MITATPNVTRTPDTTMTPIPNDIKTSNPTDILETIEPIATNVPISIQVPNTAYIGKTYKILTNYENSFNNYEFSFMMIRNKKIIITQDFTNNSFLSCFLSWKPIKTGTYTIYVFIKDENENITMARKKIVVKPYKILNFKLQKNKKQNYIVITTDIKSSIKKYSILFKNFIIQSKKNKILLPVLKKGSYKITLKIKDNFKNTFSLTKKIKIS